MLNSVKISTKWMMHPKDLGAQFFSPLFLIVGGLAALTALFHGGAGENPVGSVMWFLSECWEGLSPLALFLVALWGFHLVSYLLVGSFGRDLLVSARAAQRLACIFWRWFLSFWTGPTFLVDPSPSFSLARPFRRSLPSWLATGWRPGDSVQLE